MVFEPRTYRASTGAPDLMAFEVVVAETDLMVFAERDLREVATALVLEARRALESYLSRNPRFGESFVPVPIEPGAPAIVSAMGDAAQAAGVGPMAAVAGAVAEHVARGLAAAGSREVIVENGGDVYLMGSTERTVALWAGETGVQGVGLRIAADRQPCAVTTSSGRIGPSVSYGSADAVAVVAPSGALADAAASAIANRIHAAADIEAALAIARSIEGVAGVVATIDGAIGAWGDVELVRI